MNSENPKVTVVVPAYNVAATIEETMHAIFNQTFQDFDVVVVDDGATDATPQILARLARPGLKVVRQKNRGLAGARNTGLHHARGQYVAFCDSDDVWEAEKLELHVQHLDARKDVGISYAGSSLIDEAGKFLKVAQRPKLHDVTAADIFKRNPIGNGSAPVVRKAAFDAISYRPLGETERNWWFDENLRQSEDIDAWIRFALATDWKVEGIEGLLTRYRVNAGGLSANLDKQYETWLRVKAKVQDAAPEFAAKVAPAAESYQLRFLARRAFMMRDGNTAFSLAMKAMSLSRVPLREEPVKTLLTLAAAVAMKLLRGSINPMNTVAVARAK
jgi:glycosyltransferase involved in cell wall biosynthesis